MEGKGEVKSLYHSHVILMARGGQGGIVGAMSEVVVEAAAVAGGVGAECSFVLLYSVWLCLIIPMDQKGWTQSVTLTISLAVVWGILCGFVLLYRRIKRVGPNLPP